MVKTSYDKKDVIVLLKDLSGKMNALDTSEREHLIQSGVHYSEMLPLEYKPTEEYMKIYEESLESMSEYTAMCIGVLAEKLMNKHNNKFVIVSLARAGTPIGILTKRYIEIHYGINIPHFSISIIRGKGIDINAMNYIREVCGEEYGIEHFQFLDGWTGKGAIQNQLTDAVNQMKTDWAGWDSLSDDLAVLADPANICKIYGTKQDFLIPSACLNATVSGLFSRTILRDDLIDVNSGDFHGAVYFEDLESDDRSIEFIDTVTKYIKNCKTTLNNTKNYSDESTTTETGIDIVKRISDEYGISDINLIKPGVGETTRVLLRRIPWKVLVNKNNTDKTGISHILRLCEEKNIPVEEHDIGNYHTCGIIRDLSADA